MAHPHLRLAKGSWHRGHLRLSYLSYCWEQSGEKFQKANMEYSLIDNGFHNIRRENYGAVSSFYVTYDELLQEICKDFDIEYLWYDKICIDQTNKAEKHNEIKQMHLIYNNARYTVALVPEIFIKDPTCFDNIDWANKHTEAKSKALGQMMKSLWFQRSWTLEEVMMSTQILIVRRNTHFWTLANFKQGIRRKENGPLSESMLGFKERKTKSANQVLTYAHLRTSTKEHDKIFALANIFAEIIPVDVDYDNDVLTTMCQFYRRLAQKDLSLMCFGANLNRKGRLGKASTMGSYNLPSWTGAAGLHSNRPIVNTTLDQNHDYTIDEHMVLHIRCRYYPIQLSKYDDRDFFRDGKRMKRADENTYRIVGTMEDFDGDESEALDWNQWNMKEATDCYATHYYKPDNHTQFFSPVLPLSLTEECDECVILGVLFNNEVEITVFHLLLGYSYTYFAPVARKSMYDSSYRIIGTVLLKNFQYWEPRMSPQGDG